MLESITINLPFNSKGHILEIGGGDIPLFRPNFDMRELPTVDIVGNLEEPWPIADESFDGVFGKFVIEHVSWRKIPFFVSECYRILKPGGAVMMISPNTLEQCKEIVKLGDISTNCASLIFGGQEEPGWNEHKAAFSPNYAQTVFKLGGFSDVRTEPWPGTIWTGAKTDMTIIAFKSQHSPHVTGNRFEWMLSKIKASESIIDLGSGPDGAWGMRGFNVTTVDDNPEFHPNIVSRIEEVQLPDKTFDVAILAECLEHNDDPMPLLKSAERLAKKRIIITVPYEAHWSKNLTPFKNTGHKKFYTPELLTQELEKLGYDFTVEEIITDITYPDSRPAEHWSWVGAIINLEVKKVNNPYKEPEDTLKLKPTLPNRVKLNLGSFTVMARNWLNVDILDLTEYARQNSYLFKQHDVTTGIPCDSNSVDAIVSSHLLEHLTRKDGLKLLTECFRILKPGGILRVAIPDAKILARYYANSYNGDTSFKKQFGYNEGVKSATDEAEAFWNIVIAGHSTAYDAGAVEKLMTDIGFIDVLAMEAGISRDKDIQSETTDMYQDHTSYIEGIKPRTLTTLLDNPVAKKVAQDVFTSLEAESDSEKTARRIQSLTDSIPKTVSPLNIGLISTTFFGCPPKGYSGLEMVVWDLAEGLAELGHKVRLFAPEGSKAPTNGELVITGPALQTVNVDWIAAEESINQVVAKYSKDLDILHGHNWFGFEYSLHGTGPKICHTHHGHINPQWWLQSPPPYKLNFIAISKWMKSLYSRQGITNEFVYNGLDLSRYPFSENKGDRLLYVGRISKFKQPHVAIELAKKLKLGLDIVGGTFVDDQAYVEDIKKACDGKQITFNPDVTHEEKIKFMQTAKCLVFPSAMGEPFGLVAAETMACGTPVLALNDGAIGEVVNTGVTGFVCNSTNELINSVEKLESLYKTLNVPNACRVRSLTMFSRKIMAENYVKAYRQMLTPGGEW
jgi:glycosyltransferase involved in cell wall biosynthesis/predicted SAM-dependent methyltransferase